MICDIISPGRSNAQLLFSVKSCNSEKQILTELTKVENFQLFDAKFYKEEIA